MRRAVWLAALAWGCGGGSSGYHGFTNSDGGAVDMAAGGGGGDGGGGSGQPDLATIEQPDLASPPTPCELAAAAQSSLGCDFWTSPTLTSQLNPYFDYGLLVENPASAAMSATVTITRGGNPVAQKTIAPGASLSIPLPWIAAVSQTESCVNGACTPSTETSALVTDGAYHVASTLPVAVHQFNPLQSQKPQTANCMDPVPMNNVCHSYTSDASLVLPTATLGVEYVVLARGTFALSSGGSSTPLAGYVAIVATDDNTTVTVTSTAATEAGAGVAALAAGGQKQFTLAKGTVLELVTKRSTTPCAAMSTDANNYTYCDLGPTFDLTGSRVTADKPVAVIGGHGCAFVPYNKFACDHLEEYVPPTTAWGKKVEAIPQTPWTGVEPGVFRVVSGANQNTITFDPASVHAPVTLNMGQFLEVTTSSSFVVTGSGRLAIAQFSVGGNFSANAPSDVQGDSAMSIIPPMEQWATDYDFAVIDSFTSELLLASPNGTQIKLDGNALVLSAATIGGSGMTFQRTAVSAGAHHLSAAVPFGASLGGKAAYTAYLTPIGTNVKVLP